MVTGGLATTIGEQMDELEDDGVHTFQAGGANTSAGFDNPSGAATVGGMDIPPVVIAVAVLVLIFVAGGGS